MKKVILIIATMLVMVSCGNNRFESIGNRVVYDKETKVEYVKGPYGRMCVLVDEDGKPLIYNDENK